MEFIDESLMNWKWAKEKYPKSQILPLALGTEGNKFILIFKVLPTQYFDNMAEVSGALDAFVDRAQQGE